MSLKIKQFETLLDKKIKTDEPLSKYTTFKIGGPAKYFFIAQDNEDLVRAVTFAKKLKIPSYILGGASNVLVSDQGFNGLIIINQAKDIIFKKDNRVVADTGVNLMELVNKSVAAGLTGLEWAAGIPGTVGGAVRGNAGAYGGQISDNLIGVEVMRGSKQFILDKKNCGLGYRDSIFKRNNDLIISAEFQLQKGDKAKSHDKIKEILADRKHKQPLEFPSAGCIFQNILINSTNEDKVKQIANLPKEYLERKKVPAAWLIEQLDLKGKTIGNAQVSNEHANFIINLGKANANDVIQLISLVKMKVRNSYGIELMEEIEYVGF
ncbi:MAG: UDP-N-acetylenolpyruvoylglucosamine reductase [Candidatus Buchananbacteria bacterium RBG_13_39_9]|uniref:UDP-N-acetylenolpyruvoylglucosamine reductase n=1 Tax=Candidatus Buchananbacteria bacterium RBG_13_39_9 TaxID=1797531 RepID=A0A1G1XP47_9BACT|nr:MAG: UDP-N-acetylenolpyruvoylglucosamine reductase [Candidatus Buchananbacteria bacterium RBG_13_39_9]